VRVLDVFAGAGGLSIGLEQAGFTVVAGAEWDPDACQTFATAHPEAAVYEGDVNRTSFVHLRDEVDVVAGGPPCQPFSSGGKRRGHEDPRDGWPAFVRVLEEVRPAAFVAENVVGLAAGTRRPYFEELLGSLRESGFNVSWAVVNAADVGVPQKRHRLFVIGLRDGEFTLLPWQEGDRRGTHQPAGDVIGVDPIGEPNPSVVTYAKLPDLRPSPYDGHIYNGGGRPIDLTRPAPTLLASMGGNKTPWVDTLGVVPFYHAHLSAGGAPRSGIVEGARRITAEEAALLQTFPGDMKFAGRRSSRYRQIGNAVPPLLARTLGESLYKKLIDLL
jgi:DNA (cytosine-5)-methyltransferase 1